MNRTELGITYTESTVYDQGDNPIQCTYPTGRTVNFSRDGIRRINVVSSKGRWGRLACTAACTGGGDAPPRPDWIPDDVDLGGLIP